MKYFKHIMDGSFLYFQPEGNPNISFSNNPRNMDCARMLEEVEEGTATIEEVDDTPVLTYADHRRAAYASWGDQLDMQYHDSVDGTTTWKDHIASVKEEYPKP